MIKGRLLLTIFLMGIFARNTPAVEQPPFKNQAEVRDAFLIVNNALCSATTALSDEDKKISAAQRDHALSYLPQAHKTIILLQKQFDPQIHAGQLSAKNQVQPLNADYLTALQRCLQMTSSALHTPLTLTKKELLSWTCFWRAIPPALVQVDHSIEPYMSTVLDLVKYLIRLKGMNPSDQLAPQNINNLATMVSLKTAQELNVSIPLRGNLIPSQNQPNGAIKAHLQHYLSGQLQNKSGKFSQTIGILRPQDARYHAPFEQAKQLAHTLENITSQISLDDVLELYKKLYLALEACNRCLITSSPLLPPEEMIHLTQKQHSVLYSILATVPKNIGPSFADAELFNLVTTLKPGPTIPQKSTIEDSSSLPPQDFPDLGALPTIIGRPLSQELAKFIHTTPKNVAWLATLIENIINKAHTLPAQTIETLLNALNIRSTEDWMLPRTIIFPPHRGIIPADGRVLDCRAFIDQEAQREYNRRLQMLTQAQACFNQQSYITPDISVVMNNYRILATRPRALPPQPSFTGRLTQGMMRLAGTAEDPSAFKALLTTIAGQLDGVQTILRQNNNLFAPPSVATQEAPPYNLKDSRSAEQFIERLIKQLERISPEQEQAFCTSEERSTLRQLFDRLTQMKHIYEQRSNVAYLEPAIRPVVHQAAPHDDGSGLDHKHNAAQNAPQPLHLPPPPPTDLIQDYWKRFTRHQETHSRIGNYCVVNWHKKCLAQFKTIKDKPELATAQRTGLFPYCQLYIMERAAQHYVDYHRKHIDHYNKNIIRLEKDKEAFYQRTFWIIRWLSPFFKRAMQKQERIIANNKAYLAGLQERASHYTILRNWIKTRSQTITRSLPSIDTEQVRYLQTIAPLFGELYHNQLTAQYRRT